MISLTNQLVDQLADEFEVREDLYKDTVIKEAYKEWLNMS